VSETLDLQKATVIRLAGRGRVHLQYQPEFLRLDLEDPASGAGHYDAILRVPPCGQRYLIKIQAAPNDELLGAALNIYRTTEKDETLALAPGQRVFDGRGQCLVALESGQYEFEVLRRPDSQTLVALKTDSINTTGPTNINLRAARADPQVYGPGDQQMVLDDLFIRSARPTGGVHWQTSPNLTS
jgi:hypothetical protein